MKNNFKNILLFVVVLFTACNNNQIMRETTPHHEPVFPKGEKVTNDNFIGTVWVNYLSETDTIHHVNIGSVTFEAGARTNWHYHKGGQILLVTEGTGLYQEKGKPVEIINKGDVMKCPPDIEHWHGATPDESMTHIAIGTNTNIGGAVWLQPVSDVEYQYPDQTK